MNLSCLFLQTQLGRSIAKQLRQSLTTSMLPVSKSFTQRRLKSLVTWQMRNWRYFPVTPPLQLTTSEQWYLSGGIRGKTIRTVLCRIAYDSCAYAYKQFLKLTVGLSLDFL